MQSKTLWAVIACLALPGAVFGATLSPNKENVKNPNCDRNCLLVNLNNVLNALGDNLPGDVALSPKVKITANGKITTLGGGEVWGPARRIPYRLSFTDPVTGSALFFGVVTNAHEIPAGFLQNLAPPPPPGSGDQWWFYALRIKVVDKAITEVEQISYEAMKGFGDKEIRQMHQADRVWDTVLPESERSTREKMIKAADLYFDGISKRVKPTDVPWHPSCQRVESGMFTTDSNFAPASCGNGMKAPGFHWDVENRRYYIADVEHGVVVNMANFTIPPDAPKGFISGIVMEAFKVENGLLRHIDAYSRIEPNQQHMGWGEGPGS